MTSDIIIFYELNISLTLDACMMTAGIGWGVVGTLTKPAIGVLDLATGAANAVRDSSRGAHRSAPAKIRAAR